MEKETIDTIEDYLQLIKHYKGKSLANGNGKDFLFRGQVLDHPLISTLGRLKTKGDLLTTEQTIFNEFKRTNQLLIDQHRPLDNWDYLTLGQHYGLPTRLLDWSKNALTALWFSSGGNMPGYRLNDAAIVWILMAEQNDYLTAIEGIDPFEVEAGKIVQPRLIKQRINNQSGVFTIATSKELVEQRTLNEHPDFSGKLIKVQIPKNRIRDIRYDLDTLGVNAFTIFPELEGLCADLTWRYFENGKRRRPAC